MAKIHGIMDMGKRSMLLSQSAMQTTSHNIANKSTEGYSRQVVEQTSNPAVFDGQFRVGTGARMVGIQRVNNPWLERQIERENSSFAHLDQKAQALGRIESVLNEQNVKGLNNAIGDFFNSFRELANNAESAVARTQVRESAQGLLRNFQDVKRQVTEVKNDLNKNITLAVNEVNNFAREIATLNQKIQEIELSGPNKANDERDRRDQLLKTMSEKLDITYAEDPRTGMINLHAGQTCVMVAGTSFAQLKTAENNNGQVQILSELSDGGSQLDITEQFNRGTIGAAIEVRDGISTQLVDNLNELAFQITNEVNKAHAEGFDRYNKTGSNFFELKNPNAPFSVDNLVLNKDIQLDVGRIAAAGSPNAPADNTVANLIHSLQNRPMMDNGRYNFDDYFNSKVNEIGIVTQRVNNNLENQKNTLDQLKNIRESVSGVNMDEEAAKLIEFQKSFEASARMIRVADEMFDTVLNLKRL